MEIIFFEYGPFALKLGEASDIAETRFGYHLIEGTDKKPETTLPCEEVRERSAGELTSRKIREQSRFYARNIREKAKKQRLRYLSKEIHTKPF